MLVISNALIHTPGVKPANGHVVVEGSRIAAVLNTLPDSLPAGSELIDADGLLLTPGFIDLQLNGGFGLDFTAAPESIWEAAAHLTCFGVTSFLPTVVTSPPKVIQTAQEVLHQGPPASFSGAIPVGLHLEGPFLNPEFKGAHDRAFLRLPSLDEATDWSPENAVRLVTLAPELPGARAVIRTLVEQGVVVGAGHSDAILAQARAGLAAGIRYGTHLFNTMRPLHHREPGLVGALLANDQAIIGLIADGVHVHPEVIKGLWPSIRSRLNLVSDAMAALNMGPGTFHFGKYVVNVDESSARLADGRLAGSLLSLDAAVRNLMAFTGCSLIEALPAVTTTPAALLGLEDTKGRVAPGYDADLVLLSVDCQIAVTIVGGRIVYRRG